MLNIFGLNFGLFTLITVLMILLSILGYFQYQKKYPGHPGKYIALLLIPSWIVFFLKRYIVEMNIWGFFRQIVNILFAVDVVAFCIAVAYIMHLTYRLGYADIEKLKKLKPLLITSTLIIVVSVMYIVFYAITQG